MQLSASDRTEEVSSGQLMSQHIILAEVKMVDTDPCSLQFLRQLVKLQTNRLKWQLILLFIPHANRTRPSPWIQQRKQDDPPGFILKQLLDALNSVDVVSLMAVLACCQESVHVSLQEIQSG